MIICSNCGAINSDENSRFCRKCGALLPVVAKPSRIRIPTSTSTNQEKKVESSTINDSIENNAKIKDSKQNIPHINREAGFFTSKAEKKRKTKSIRTTRNPPNSHTTRSSQTIREST